MLGIFKGRLISIDPNVKNIQCIARKVPLALRSKINASLDTLSAVEVIGPFNPSYTKPVVPLIKYSGEIRVYE